MQAKRAAAREKYRMISTRFISISEKQKKKEEEESTPGGTMNKSYAAEFAHALVQIYLDNAGDLELVAKYIGSLNPIGFLNLDFLVYGDTFFEVALIGGRTQPRTTKPDGGERHPYSLIDCEPNREAILPSVIYIHKILRRRPWLIEHLENVLGRLLQSLELFEENERKKLAIFTALAFSQKLSGLKPETVFQPLLKDNLVGKGIALTFVTDFFKEYLVDNSSDDLIAIIKRGKMEDNLLDFFASSKKSAEAFSEHFSNAGLTQIVEYNERRTFEVKLKEMKTALTAQIADEADIAEVIETVKHIRNEAKLPDIEVICLLWDAIMDAIYWPRRNPKACSSIRQVNICAALLKTFCTSGKLELELMYKIQDQCCHRLTLTELFPEIVESLYNLDVLAEDTILYWFRKRTNPNHRQTSAKLLEDYH